MTERDTERQSATERVISDYEQATMAQGIRPAFGVGEISEHLPEAQAKLQLAQERAGKLFEYILQNEKALADANWSQAAAFNFCAEYLRDMLSFLEVLAGTQPADEEQEFPF